MKILIWMPKWYVFTGIFVVVIIIIVFQLYKIANRIDLQTMHREYVKIQTWYCRRSWRSFGFFKTYGQTNRKKIKRKSDFEAIHSLPFFFVALSILWAKKIPNLNPTNSVILYIPFWQRIQWRIFAPKTQKSH